MDDVEAILSVIESEVKPYLDGTKRGEAIQPELPLGEEKVTKIEIAENLTPKKAEKAKNGSTKKTRQTAENPSGIINE